MEASSSASAADAGVYVPLVQRDLNKLVTLVVPPTKEGILNSLSAQQILKSWKTRRVIDPSRVEAAEALLIAQKSQCGFAVLVVLIVLYSSFLCYVNRSQQQHQNGHAPAAPGKSSAATKFSRNDILRRIEDDRERVRHLSLSLTFHFLHFDLICSLQHKRLRERAWVLPVPSTIAGLERIARPALLNILGPSAGLNLGPSQPSPFSPTSPASVSQASRQHGRPQAHQRGSQQSEQQQQQQQGANAAELDPIDVEFEQLWEKEMLQSDGQGITPEELEAMRAESQRAFGP